MYTISYFHRSTKRMTSVSCIADLIKEQHLMLKKHLGFGLVPLIFLWSTSKSPLVTGLI